MYIALAILIFGILVIVHELGHFTAAKAVGVKVNEFAIGMGPVLLKRQGKETKYTLRLFPIGGFCAMEGEDESSDDPGSFFNKSLWRRFVILFAGSFMNFFTGFLIILMLFAGAGAFRTTTLSGFMDGFPNRDSNPIMAGDTIYSIDNERIYLFNDISTFLMRGNGKTADIVVVRDGKKVLLKDFPIALKEYTVNGETSKKYGFLIQTEDATFLNKLKYSWYNSMSFVRLVRLSIGDLIGGKAGMKDLSGPVGIVGVINDIGNAAPNVGEAIENIAYIFAFIAINLAVMNLLPIPALDGGRIFFMFVTWAIEKISRRKINPKYEGYIHATGFFLLIGIMIFTLFNDIVKLVVK